MSQPQLDPSESRKPAAYMFSTICSSAGKVRRGPGGIRALVWAAALAGLVGAQGCSRSGSGSSASAKGPLTIVRTHPAGGAEKVPVDQAVEVTFSQEVDPATVTDETFSIEGTSTGKKSGSRTFASKNRSVTFFPSEAYGPGETVQVSLTAEITSQGGLALEPRTFSFKVKPGEQPPEDPPPKEPLVMSSTIPEPNARGVPRDQIITVVWSEALDPATVTGENVWLSGEAGVLIPTTLDPLADGDRQLVMLPGRTFHGGESISVHMGSSIRSASGAGFEGGVLQFTAKSDAPPAERKTQKVFTALGRVNHMRAADMNRDGPADLVYSAENETIVDVLLGKADGTLTPALRIEAGDDVLSLLVADHDKDGDQDILVGTKDRVKVYDNLSIEEEPDPLTLRFDVGIEIPVGVAVRGIALGDLDHAGAPDLVLDTEGGLEIRLGDDPTKVVQTIGAGRQARTEVVIADLNLDGHLDLAFGERRGGGINYYLSSGHVSQDSGGPLFTSPSRLELEVDAEQLAASNLLGDEFPELVVLTAEGASLQGAAFRVFLGTALGFRLLEPAEIVDSGGSGAAADSVLDTGRFTLADMDGDGLEDLVLSAMTLGKVVWFRNQGGSLGLDSPGLELLSLPEPWTVLAADLRDSGSQDLAVAGGNEVHILLPFQEEPPPPEETFELRVDSVQALQGDKAQSVPVRLTNTSPLDGYVVLLGYNPEAISPTGVSFDGTVTGATSPDFFLSQKVEGEPIWSCTVITEMMPPMEGKVIPAGESQLLLRLVFDVLETAPVGQTPITFPEVSEPAPLSTSLVVGGLTVRPELGSGNVLILPGTPHPTGNHMALSTAVAAAGEEFRLDLLGWAEEEAGAFTTIVAFDNSVMEVLEFDLAGSLTEAQNPELVIPVLKNDQGYAVLTVMVDFLPPIEGRTLPAGEGMKLCSVRCKALAGAPAGVYPIRLQDGLGDPPLSNIFVFDGLSIPVGVTDGALVVEETGGPTFLRGDVDGSGSFSITDPVALVNYLFKGGARPPCMKAADADDSGVVDITDAVYLLNHLFKGGPAPPLPYPTAGTDPTADELTCLGS